MTLSETTVIFSTFIRFFVSGADLFSHHTYLHNLRFTDKSICLMLFAVLLNGKHFHSPALHFDLKSCKTSSVPEKLDCLFKVLVTGFSLSLFCIVWSLSNLKVFCFMHNISESCANIFLKIFCVQMSLQHQITDHILKFS